MHAHLNACVFRGPASLACLHREIFSTLPVCLDTVYLCSDSRCRSGLCAPMYSSCSFSLPPLPYCSLFFFLSLSFLTVCSSLSPTAARHTNTHNTQRYTSTRAFMRTFTFKYTHMHYLFSCTLGYMTDISLTTCTYQRVGKMHESVPN